MEDDDIFTGLPATGLTGSNLDLTIDPVPAPQPTAGNTAFPKILSSEFFPEAPTLQNPSAAAAFLPFLLDEESYLSKFATPSLTDKQIDKLYKDTDFKDERLLALSQFGFGLLQPTVGGKIGASLSAATQGLTSNLSKIKAAQRKETKENQVAKITTKMKKDAQAILDRKGVFDANRTLLTSIAGKEYDAAIASDKAKMDLYRDQVKAAQTKFQDYQLEGVEPKRVQIRMKGPDGEMTDPIDAFVVQSILDDGSLSSPQYYRPTNELGTDGLPVMELISNPEGIIEVKTTITGAPQDFNVGKNVASFLDVKGGLDVTDRALLTLDALTASFQAKPNRAGFLAGIQKRFQTYAQIFSDSYNYQFNDFFKEGNEKLGIAEGTKFQSLSSTINIYLNDPSIQEDLRNGVLDEEDLASLRQADAAFEQLGVVGRAQMNAELNQSTDKYGVPLFKSEEEKQAIFNKLGFFDTDLPANEVRANAIIYAIARARKSSGRLNLDDIERAAKDLNIYGDSSADVLTKIDVIRNELLAARADNLSTIQLVFPSYYEQMLEQGYGSYNRDRITNIVQETVTPEQDTSFLQDGFTIDIDGGVTQNK